MKNNEDTLKKNEFLPKRFEKGNEKLMVVMLDVLIVFNRNFSLYARLFGM